MKILVISGLAILLLQIQLLGNTIQDELEKFGNMVISEEDFLHSNENIVLAQKTKLGILIQKASVKELVDTLHNLQRQNHIDFFLYICADKLSVDQYINFIFELSKSKNENISKNTWGKILFPNFQKRGILEYNYRDPKVNATLVACKILLIDSPIFNLINDIQKGICLKKSLARKFERYHDNFSVLPIKENAQYLPAIKLMALCVAWYEMKELIEQAKQEDSKQFSGNRQFVELESHLSTQSLKYSFEEILQQSGFIFAKEASPESIDFTTEKGAALLDAISGSKGILFQQISLEEKREIKEMYIDILYLTIFNSSDWRVFLSLLGDDDRNIRQYAYNRIEYLGKIDLDTPLTKTGIDSLAQKYHLFKDNRDSIKQ